jgi:hypothetical protein
MINSGESRVKGVEVAIEGGVTVTVEWCANFPGYSLKWNFFAMESTFSILEMVHRQSLSTVKNPGPEDPALSHPEVAKR